MNLSTPKGFRDFLPKDALKRKFVLDKIIKVFEKFGFDPLETPTLEYASTLKGKYGEEERLIYEFKTRGGDEVALRYDQTVPTSRVVAQYQDLPKPFRRYQIQSAFRGENTQKGRYREFLQCDADIIGTTSLLADTELLALLYEIYQTLGLDIILAVNDRKLLEGVEPKFLSALDKLDKIGPEEVKKELEEKGLSKDQAEALFEKITKSEESENLKQIRENFIKLGYPGDKLVFNPTIIRGLDYYTGMIVEVRLSDSLMSLAGGGRYDNLIGKFSGQETPATGFAIGFDRTVEAMEEKGVLQSPSTNSKVLITIYSQEDEYINSSINLLKVLRSENINAEIWLDIQKTDIGKQAKYASKKGIPYFVIIGPENIKNNNFNLVDLSKETDNKYLLSLDELIKKLSH